MHDLKHSTFPTPSSISRSSMSTCCIPRLKMGGKNKMTNNITTTSPWIPGTNLYNMPWMPGTMDSRDNITTQCQGQNTKLKIYSKTNPGCQSSTTNKLNIIFMDLTSLPVGNHAGFDLGLPLRCCQLLTSGDALILQAVGVPGQVVFFGVNPHSS